MTTFEMWSCENVTKPQKFLALYFSYVRRKIVSISKKQNNQRRKLNIARKGSLSIVAKTCITCFMILFLIMFSLIFNNFTLPNLTVITDP